MKSQYHLFLWSNHLAKRFPVLVAGIASFLAMTTSDGQGLDAGPAGIMISHGHPKGGWMFSCNYMSMMMKGNLSGTSKVNDDYIFYQSQNHQLDYQMSPQNMRMDMHMLMAMYGVSGSFTLMAMTNYNVMTMDMKMYAPTMTMENGQMMMVSSGLMTTHSSGIGDTKLYGLYKLLRKEGSSLALVVGVSIPTGRVDLNGGDVYANLRLPYTMQLGTGSFDLLPGITYLKKKGKVSWSVEALTAFRPFYNAEGYHYSNELTVNGWASYHVCSSVSGSVRLESYTASAIQGNDAMIPVMTEPDANPNNYGGQRASGYAGVNYYIHKSNLYPESKLSIEYGIPFYQNLNGPQLATQSTLFASLTTSF